MSYSASKKFVSALVFLSIFFTSVTQAAITWSPINGPGGGEITSFEFVSSTEIWASSREGLIYKTTDGGASWSEVTGLVGANLSSNKLTIAVSSGGTYYAHIGTELFSSSDSGANWSSVKSDVGAIYIDSADTLYISEVVLDLSIFQYVSQISSSTNSGTSWTKFGELKRNTTASASVITQDAAGNFYGLLTFDGVYRSSD